MNKTDRILEAANHAAKEASGKLGMGFMDVETGDTAFINGKEVFPTASVSKIYTLGELMRQVDAGILSLDTRYALEEKYQCYGSGILNSLRPGMELTLYDYAVLMMSLSDNTATDFIMSLVGFDSLKKNLIDAFALADTKVELTAAELIYLCGEFKPEQSFEEMWRQYLFGDFRNSKMYGCRAARNNVTTPGDMTRFMGAVANGKWVNANVCESMISIMKLCADSHRLVKHLPPDISVAHKTGELDRVANDVALVFSPKGRFILSLFYNGTCADEKEYFGRNARGYFGCELLASVGSAVYEAYVK